MTQQTKTRENFFVKFAKFPDPMKKIKYCLLFSFNVPLKNTLLYNKYKQQLINNQIK